MMLASLGKKHAATEVQNMTCSHEDSTIVENTGYHRLIIANLLLIFSKYG